MKRKRVSSSVLFLILISFLLSACEAKTEETSSVQNETSTSQTEIPIRSQETISTRVTSATFDQDVDNPSIILTVDEDEYLTDVETQSVELYAETNFTAECVEIKDLNGNVICTLYDDGNYIGVRSDIGGDSVYTGEVDIDTSAECTYEFRAEAVFKDEVISSETITVYVFRYFTDQDWANMDLVNDAIVEFLNSPEYNALSEEEKPDAVIEFLTDIAFNGIGTHDYSLIVPDSIYYDGYEVQFEYDCGAPGCVTFEDYMANSTVPIG